MNGSIRLFFLSVIAILALPAAGTLTRYSGYTITSNQADRDTAAELLAAGGTDRGPGRREYCAVATGAYRHCSLEI